jgi:hypothetical protein
VLGHYENFPRIIHGVARFSYSASRGKVQQTIASAFYQLNREKSELREIAYSTSPSCEVDFELGVGEENIFTFLDKSELGVLETEIAKKVLLFLDFLCVLQYHVVDESGKRSPLKFDYYMLRFVFDGNYVEFLVSHERGPQRVHVEDLMDFLMKYIKKKLADRYSVALKLEGTRTV